MASTTITLIFFAAGLLIIALSIPLIRRRIAPNPLYGLRIRATFADEWVWYEANARSGKDLLLLGIAICALAILLRIVPGIKDESYPVIHSVAILVAVIIVAVVGVRRANRLLADRIAGGEQLKPRDPLRSGPFRSMRRK